MLTKVLIADDHQAVRAGITAMLVGTEFEVAAVATTCDQAVRYTLACDPVVVVLDLRMGEGDGLDVLARIKAERPDSKVLLFTLAENIAAMIQARELGADGYLTKDADRDVFLAAMRRLADGKRVWTRRQLRQIGTAKRRRYAIKEYVGLTEREQQVLTQIVRGQTNDEIATVLEVDVETVKQHVKGLLGKLVVEDRTQAALWAIRTGAVC
jgi:DNA-binding NarL/FixJ family response regulator